MKSFIRVHECIAGAVLCLSIVLLCSVPVSSAEDPSAVFEQTTTYYQQAPTYQPLQPSSTYAPALPSLESLLFDNNDNDTVEMDTTTTTATSTPPPDQNWENEVDGGNRSVLLSDAVAEAVKFYLYKRVRLEPSAPLQRQGKSIRSDTTNEIVFGSRVVPTDDFDREFDPNLETKILIHGWLNSKDTDNFQLMKENYLRKEDMNVLVVDWSKLSYGFNYLRAAGYVPELGAEVGRFIGKIIDMGAIPQQIHLIGHSLGAHVAGSAGSMFNGRISRITGLDPALPSFDHFKDADQRLDSTDAKFVDIIHTCAGTLGLFAPIGHVDFYPNGGTPSQPGCQAASELTGCSHGRSIEFFFESILSENGFWGEECATWDDYKKRECKPGFVQMGDPALNSSRGVFYLGTRDTKPFAVGPKHFFHEDPFIRTLYYRLIHGITSVVDFISGR